MVSKYDLLYSVYLNEALTVSELVKKLGKKQDKYRVFYNHLKQLEKEGFVEFRENKCYLKKTKKTTELLGLVDFCVKNSIDYNKLFLHSTIDFIEIGLKKGLVRKAPFDNKTVVSISRFLSKHGFLLIESKKPFLARLVYSDFLRNVAESFKGKPKIKCRSIFEGVDESRLNIQIEKEFSEYKKTTKTIDLGDEIQFIHRSLSLEGNTLTLPETERLIKENIPAKGKSFREMQEVVDYKKALDELISDRESLSMDKTLKFHATAMNTLKAGAGKTRRQNVRIAGNPDFKTADWREVPLKLKELFKYYSESINKKMKAFQAVELASYLHSEFQHTHPFIDGNSRTARAIFIHILLAKGFPLIAFPAGFIDQYMQLTKLSKERNDKNLEIFMKQLVLHSLKQTNQRIKYA